MKTKIIIATIALSYFALDINAQSQLTVEPVLGTQHGRVGVNQFAPSNRLEITSHNLDPYFGSVNGSSGLKFTNLTSSSTPFPSTTGVLSVDATGNVILVANSTSSITGANDGLSISGTNVQLGGLCGSGLGSLLNTREIPMAGFNINYTMPALSPSQILIGASACTTGVGARVAVFSDTYRDAGGFLTQGNYGANTATGVTGVVKNLGSGDAIGIQGTSLGSAGGLGIGINGSSSSATSFRNYGIHGLAANGTNQSIGVTANVTSSSSPQNYGVTGNIQTGTNAGATNYGMWSNVVSPGVNNYGLYAFVSGGTSNYGVYATVSPLTTGNYAGYFNGDVYTTGGSHSLTGYLVASDRKFKTNIHAVINSSDILKKLKPSSYYYDTTANNGTRFSSKKQYGFIAQELEEVLPELVYNIKKPADIDQDGKVIHEAISHKAVNYDGFIALLTAELQVQQTKNDKQDSTIAAMQKQISRLLAANEVNNNMNNATTISTQNINLSDADVVVLNQNQPNPFAEQTIISYNIPQNTGTAQMLFYDVNGKQINSVTITTKGKGALNVYASDLSNGMYSYTLIVDGQIVDTKKMVRQQ